MSDDEGGGTFTEVTEESWIGRLGKSIAGVGFGIALFLIAFPLLWWNEGRAVQTYKSLSEGAGAVVSAAVDRVDAANDGKLVHVTGLATTAETLSDPTFGISVQALKLDRKVRMYQWQEKSTTKEEKKLGGGKTKVTEYTYEKAWADRLIDSAKFKRPEDHQNPQSMPHTSRTSKAREVTVGGFDLSIGMAGMIGGARPITVSSEDVPSKLKEGAMIHEDNYYLGNDPLQPEIGDLQVSFSETPATQVSIVAKQSGKGFTAYQTQAGNRVSMLVNGTRTAEEMFQSAQASNQTWSWILRAVGFLMMFIGLMMVFAPLAVLADIVPFIGSLVGVGTALIAGLIALPSTLVTIAIAWIVYRPVLGIVLLVVALGSLAAVMSMRKSEPEAQPA
jgi:hypothetical protein